MTTRKTLPWLGSGISLGVRGRGWQSPEINSSETQGGTTGCVRQSYSSVMCMFQHTITTSTG